MPSRYSSNQSIKNNQSKGRILKFLINLKNKFIGFRFLNLNNKDKKLRYHNAFKNSNLKSKNKVNESILKKIPWLLIFSYFRTLIIFSFALLTLFIIGSLLYVRLILFSKIPNQIKDSTDSKWIDSCSIYKISQKITTYDSYGYFILLRNNEVFKMYIVHIGNNNEGKSYIQTVEINKDQWLKFTTSSRFSYVMVSNVYNASQIDLGKKSTCYLMKNLSYQFGIPIDFVILENKKENQKFILENIIKGSKMNSMIQSWRYLFDLKNMYSNISIGELIKLQQYLSLNKSNITNYNLNQKFVENIKYNGQDIKVINFDLFLQDKKEILESEQITLEQATVEIYNATGESGLATIYSRYLKTVGVDIIRIGNIAKPDKNKKDIVEIYINNRNDKKYVYTLNMIEKVFTTKKIVYVNKMPFNGLLTADIIVSIY